MEYQTIVKVQNKGLITLPKNIRQMLGINQQSYVRVVAKGSKAIIEPVSVLPYAVRSYTDKEVQEFFELDKQERANTKNA